MCVSLPVFMNTTLSPVFTVIVAGSNFHAVFGSPAPSTMFTVCAPVVAPPPLAGFAVGATAAAFVLPAGVLPDDELP